MRKEPEYRYSEDATIRYIKSLMPFTEYPEVQVKKVGPTHCTGDRAIQMFKRAYGPHFMQMGVGRTLKFEAIKK